MGAAAVMAGSHWVAVTRTLTPRVAGGAGVPLRLAGPVIVVSGTLTPRVAGGAGVPLTTITGPASRSGTAWATTVILLARVLGERVATGAGWVAAVVVGVLFVVLLVRSVRRHHHTHAETLTGS